MASYTLDVGPYWPAGTTLNAYTTASFGLPGGQSPNGTPPVGSPVDTAVVSSAGTVTFSALAVNVGYRIGPGTNPYFYLHFKEGASTSSAGSGGSAAPTIVVGGNLGATRSESVAANVEEWLTGTLTANLTLTVTLAAGARLRFFGKQDATGGRTLLLSDGQTVAINSIANSSFEVDFYSPDGTTIYFNQSGSGPQGAQGPPGIQGVQGVQGPTGATGPAGTPDIWQPGDNGLKASSHPTTSPFGIISILTGGQKIVTSRIPIKNAMTVANLNYFLWAAGTVLTGAYGLLYKLDGTLIARTADLSTVWTTNALKTSALIAESGQSLSLPAADVIAAVIVNTGSTYPTFLGNTSAHAALINVGQSSPAFAAGSATATGGAVPTTLSGLTANTLQPWMALT